MRCARACPATTVGVELDWLSQNHDPGGAESPIGTLLRLKMRITPGLGLGGQGIGSCKRSLSTGETQVLMIDVHSTKRSLARGLAAVFMRRSGPERQRDTSRNRTDAS
jgi:hypothetical protein